MDIQEKRILNSICKLKTRQFGNVGEIIVSKIVNNITKSDDLSYDRNQGNKKIEIKVSRAFIKKNNPITEENILSTLLSENTSTLVNDLNKTEMNWDCNIQQIKVECFDVLYYGVFLEDIVYIFKLNGDQIVGDKAIGYSDKQHRGNTGEGQFHLKSKNIDYHIDNYLFKKLNYKEIFDILNNTQKTLDICHSLC